MKRKLLFLSLGLCLVTPVKANAKDVCINTKWSEEKIVSYLGNHKSDSVYMVVQGKRIAKNGDGIDANGWYIKYTKGKVGQEYTSVFLYEKGTTYWDDWCERYDYKGHISKKKAIKKLKKEMKG